MPLNWSARIVVVEDSLPDVMLLGEALKEYAVPHELIHYRDGAEAVAKLNDPATLKLPPHLIVLDLNMPKMGGLEVLARLRRTNAFMQVPIAILSSSLQPEEQAAARRLGANRFIQKPVDLYSYLDEVGKTLRDLLALGSYVPAA
jgi:two-component system response regulator